MSLGSAVRGKIEVNCRPLRLPVCYLCTPLHLGSGPDDCGSGSGQVRVPTVTGSFRTTGVSSECCRPRRCPRGIPRETLSPRLVPRQTGGDGGGTDPPGDEHFVERVVLRAPTHGTRRTVVDVCRSSSTSLVDRGFFHVTWVHRTGPWDDGSRQ